MNTQIMLPWILIVILSVIEISLCKIYHILSAPSELPMMKIT